MTTPYFDSLNDAQKALVQKHTRLDQRPSYYDRFLDQEVQVSIDLEALLILAPRSTKQQIVSFITDAASEAAEQDANEFALFTEVVAARRANYGQVFTDAGSRVRSFQRAQAGLMGFVEQSRQDENTEVVIPALSQFFASVSTAYNKYNRPDELAMHDRISDAGFLIDKSDNSSVTKELQSWLVVFNTYKIV